MAYSKLRTLLTSSNEKWGAQMTLTLGMKWMDRLGQLQVLQDTVSIAVSKIE